jgi:hypothetical protein
MTTEQLKARKAEVEAHRAKNAAEIEATRAHLTLLQAADHTLHGVIQDCDHWLEQDAKLADSGMAGTALDPGAAAVAAESAAVASAVGEAHRQGPELLKDLKSRRNARLGVQTEENRSKASA